MPKFRQNPLTGDWVILAPERAIRPEDYAVKNNVKTTTLKHADCLFCEGGKAWVEKIEGLGSENVYVIPNKFPAFVQNEHVIEEGHSFYVGGKSIGAHEVIVMTDHQDNLFTAPKGAIYDIFKTFQDRYRHYGKDPDIDYIMGINNTGEEAGASVEHPHCQLLASSVVPALMQRELRMSSKYYLEKGHCLLCDIVKQENEFVERKMFENEDAVALTPFAPRFPFETWIIPKHHESDFRLEKNLKSISSLFDKVMKTMGEKLGVISLNFFIHSCPTRDTVVPSYHWHLEITPRLSRIGGYEVGAGAYIDIMPPEKAAWFLRK